MRRAARCWLSFASTALCICVVLAVSQSLVAADGVKLAASPESAPNTLSDAEKSAGWKLLFDGKSVDGWRGYKRQDIRPGWKVLDGTLVCADPRNAGDLITKDKFDAFELSLDYNMSAESNSGVIFHATEEGPTSWTTGPEVQLFDNNQTGSRESQWAGWLYQLYKPADDPKTGKPIDATKPAGQWNTLRLLITPQKCEASINGVKYYDFVIGSHDWNERVAKSKFASMAGFGKAGSGHVVLQGDHGQVSFRNIKLRPMEKK